MEEKKTRKVIGAPVGGIIILFLGIVFLLQTLGALPWGVWGVLWRFWPVLIIVAGLGLLMQRFNIWLVSAAVLAILIACLGIAIWQYNSNLAGIVTQTYSEPLGDVEEASVTAELTMGGLSLDSLPAGSAALVNATYGVQSGKASMVPACTRQGNQADLSFTSKPDNWRWWYGEGANWKIDLTGQIPLTVTIRSQLSTANLDLSELNVTDLRLFLDVGSYTIMLPESAGATQAHILATVSNIEVAIPANVAARIQTKGSLSTIEIDENRFPNKGSYYESEGFLDAQNRIELEISCDVGRVTVK